jgi:hypothetical protein
VFACLIDGFGVGSLDLLTSYSHNSGLQAIQRYRWSTHFTIHCYTCTRVLSLHSSYSGNGFITFSLSLQITHKVFFSQPTPFLPLFCSCQFRRQFNSSAPKFISRQAGVSKYNSTRLSLILRPTVSRPGYLGIKHPSGAYNHIFITVRQFSLLMWALSLTRGWVCPLQLLLAFASAVTLGSKSRGTRVHILLTQIWDLPFRRLLRLAGLRWRYSTSPPLGLLAVSVNSTLHNWILLGNHFAQTMQKTQPPYC